MCQILSPHQAVASLTFGHIRCPERLLRNPRVVLLTVGVLLKRKFLGSSPSDLKHFGPTAEVSLSSSKWSSYYSGLTPKV